MKPQFQWKEGLLLWIRARTEEAVPPDSPCEIISCGGEHHAIRALSEVFEILSSLVWGKQVTTLASLFQPKAGQRDTMDQGQAVSTESPWQSPFNQ